MSSIYIGCLQSLIVVDVVSTVYDESLVEADVAHVAVMRSLKWQNIGVDYLLLVQYLHQLVED